MNHPQTKHINIHYHYIHEKVKNWDTTMVHTGTSNNIAYTVSLLSHSPAQNLMPSVLNLGSKCWQAPGLRGSVEAASLLAVLRQLIVFARFAIMSQTSGFMF
jgi:hypothetical protein